ncbi:hypothetical protein EMIHUDRAFT_446712, partial [Emiliania huxleyi CCMP1516]|uniref:Uncharacterized protein n=2 Tax=Emiliania huxleyi TaxID=2903 RepID=A0A0D3HXE5_EMIH1
MRLLQRSERESKRQGAFGTGTNRNLLDRDERKEFQARLGLAQKLLPAAGGDDAARQRRNEAEGLVEKAAASGWSQLSPAEQAGFEELWRTALPSLPAQEVRRGREEGVFPPRDQERVFGANLPLALTGRPLEGPLGWLSPPQLERARGLASETLPEICPRCTRGCREILRADWRARRYPRSAREHAGPLSGPFLSLAPSSLWLLPLSGSFLSLDFFLPGPSRAEGRAPRRGGAVWPRLGDGDLPARRRAARRRAAPLRRGDGAARPLGRAQPVALCPARQRRRRPPPVPGAAAPLAVPAAESARPGRHPRRRDGRRRAGRRARGRRRVRAGRGRRRRARVERRGVARRACGRLGVGLRPRGRRGVLWRGPAPPPRFAAAARGRLGHRGAARLVAALSLPPRGSRWPPDRRHGLAPRRAAADGARVGVQGVAAPHAARRARQGRGGANAARAVGLGGAGAARLARTRPRACRAARRRAQGALGAAGAGNIERGVREVQVQAVSCGARPTHMHIARPRRGAELRESAPLLSSFLCF